VVEGGDAVRALDDPRFVDFADVVARFPATPIADV
jgi:hypothetical protein